jgi:nickel-dependent lactate racemase
MNKENPIRGISRRNFIKYSGAGAALLAGNAFLRGKGLSKDIILPKDNSITITTHEWFGDLEERLDFPEDWQIHFVELAGANTPVLTAEEIRQKISSPIGTKLLRDIASGKKTAVITFDDLTRPTPVSVVAPLIIEELKAGGIKEENILFVASYGNHRIMSQVEVRAKLGDEIVEKYPWINHNVWENLTDVGETSFKNRIKVNFYFMKADVKVCISGIKHHGMAGYGGGGKAVLPGVAWIESTSFNHRKIAGGGSRKNETVGMGKIFKNEVRLDMEEAAELAAVDFTAQIVYNGKRKPVGVFAGASRKAHREACKMANRHYRTQPFQQADIVIANSYPQTRHGIGALGWVGRSIKEGGSAVLILQNPMGLSSWHYHEERTSFRSQSYWDMLPTNVSSPVPKARQIIVFSQYLQKREMNKFPPKYVQFAKTWDQVLELLRKNHKGKATVAVYPYAAIQHPPVELDSEA